MQAIFASVMQKFLTCPPSLPRRASAAVNHLKRFHEKKRRGPRPHSLYLDQIIRKAIDSPYRREAPVRTYKDIYASIKVCV